MTAATVYTIQGGIPFVDALAAGILEQSGGDPLALSRMTVLLPNRRACRVLRDAFLRLGDGRPILPPRMSPLGDLDAEALDFELEELPGPAGLAEIPPALSDVRRQVLLTRLILSRRDLALTPDQAAWLATELARLIDQVHTQGLTFDRLADLVPEALAEHWRLTVAFLGIVSETWPKILAAEGGIDKADRRNRLLSAQTELWRARPPADPVIAAGSTGSIPATAALLTVVAGLPAGAVVLPGLDRAVDDETWAAIDEGHPQFGMRELLAGMGVDRRMVADWPAAARHRPFPDRSRLVTQVLRPAVTTDAWRTPGDVVAPMLEGLERIDCPTPQEEAGVIAMLMREALEAPGRTAALVTPDRRLARRTAVALQRWGVAVDDSGGRPLAETPVGAFLRLACDCAVQGAAPVALLALLKHPLAAGGQAPGQFRRAVRTLERALLRGPRPAPGLAGLQAALATADRRQPAIADERAGLRRWLARFERMAAPFFALVAGTAAPAALLAAHGRFVEDLAATDDEPGAARLWRHEDGEAAAQKLADLAAAAADMPAIDGRHYPGLLDALLAGVLVRPHYGRHPRLFIWGPLEARLQQADLLILGGLNEGTWPAEAAVDPWMSRPMRLDFGLPAPERRIGLSAHDFAQALAAPRVVLTRSQRVDGTPTVPSRWLLRLDAVLEGAGLPPQAQWSAAPRLALLRALDEAGAARPIVPPAPRPPAAARPRRLSVTEIGTWMSDPYAVYARRVLGLEPLEPLEAEPDAADLGQVVHAALAAFMQSCPGALPAEAHTRLLDLGRQAFGPLLAHPGIRAFWWPRFERIADWLISVEAHRRAVFMPAACEVAGRLTLVAPGGPFTLTARADRIDRAADGRLAIIDYKTGGVPGDADIDAGVAPQLPLEAAIAVAGGFDGIAGAAVAELAHWRLSGRRPAGEVRTIDPARIDRLIGDARAGLLALVARFDDPATPYLSQPRPERVPRYSDYDHLARVQEWAAGPAGDEA